MGHPLLAPLLRELVFVGEGAIGYPIDGGRALRRHDGTTTPLPGDEQLRVAHPHDLFATHEWHLWQAECFASGRVQPFKQLFRELYLPTAAERGEALSRRYAGHQVNPHQALALFGQRGWVADPEEGVRRTFHDADLTAFAFADDDPRTAEVLSKVLLLARDREIKDPTILEQILA
jgi:hypothetical protein